MRFHQQLINATSGRRELQIYYEGFLRVVEPHTYGIDYRGHHVLRAYQIAGGSERAHLFSWKVIRTDEISHLCETGTRFHSARPGYRREALPMKRIYARF
ncbi:hypothetical protein [Paraburkholderia sp. 22B1P]|uniref:hypothetical protein n=1 Tax=Paraburkholderia sp. 22B1P TaxID=3080498 RepID=UPI00309290F2|nr:WYL domain-containing protein [Paraburkholderia sp. 22B1P]